MAKGMKVVTVYAWANEGGPPDVLFARRGKWGYHEHNYNRISNASVMRVLNATPFKPTRIVQEMVVWEIKK